MASLAPYSITLGATDYPVKYSGLLSYIEPYLTNLETFTFSAGNVSLAGNFSLGAASDFTLNKGTANGVVYLNGSKVATSGSALTFDGALLAVGGTATEKITTNGAIRVTGSQTTAGTGTYLSQASTSLGELAHYGPDNSTIGQLRFYLASANGGIGGEQMRLTSTGLGIGTSSPNAKLEVNGNAILGAEVYRSSDTSYLRIAGGNPATTGANLIVFGSTHATAPGRISVNAVGTGHIEFSAGGAERARITSGGAFGVNITNPNAFGQFTVKWDATATSTNNTVGIGIQPAAATSGAQFIQFYNEAGAGIGNVTRNGTTNAVLYNTTSDYRLKTFISKVTGAGARIDALNPIEYAWKADGARAKGFFAHEFQQIYAGSVTGEKDAVDAEGKPVYQSMQASTSEVIADLVAEIQSLRARVQALEAQP